MKIAISQFKSKTADVEYNKNQIIKEINKAVTDEASLVLFPQNSISGQNLLSLLEYEEFLEFVKKAYDFILKNIPSNIYVLLDYPKINEQKKVESVMTLIKKENGELKIQIEKNIPREKNESLFFLFERKIENFNLVFLSQNKILEKENLKIKNGDIVIVNSTIPFYQESQSELKYNLIDKLAEQKLICLRPVGAYENIVYQGSSFYMDEKRCLVKQLKSFEEDYAVINIQESSKESFKEEDKYHLILEAIKLGIKTYYKENKFKGIHLGLSGGIDSAVVLAIASMVIDKDKITPIMMPSRFSSDGSIDDATRLCKNLAVDYKVISIEDNFKQYEKLFETEFKKDRMTLQNIQARIRGNILMAYSNTYFSMLLETGNKTEALLGYCTLYGDTCGAIAVIGDLYKKEVYELAKFINKDKELIPKEIIEKAPSAELDYKQTDEANLPASYSELDSILMDFIEKKKSDFSKEFEEKTVKDVLNLLAKSEHKRRQLPPIIKLKKSSLNGLQFPINYKKFY